MAPELFIMAGAPGSGKSRAFPVTEFNVDFFNADDRAAQLNSGSYHEIPLSVRQQVNREFESFISSHIEQGVSFAYETTLRSEIVFEQIAAAHQHGFQITMRYLGIEDIEINLRRIRARHRLGFHAAPSEVLRAIHVRSFANLPVACRMAFAGQMHLILYDNTSFGGNPTPVYEISKGLCIALREQLPLWVRSAIAQANIS
jgi:predicted ABC-type ATPase